MSFVDIQFIRSRVEQLRLQQKQDTIIFFKSKLIMVIAADGAQVKHPGCI